MKTKENNKLVEINKKGLFFKIKLLIRKILHKNNDLPNYNENMQQNKQQIKLSTKLQIDNQNNIEINKLIKDFDAGVVNIKELSDEQIILMTKKYKEKIVYNNIKKINLQNSIKKHKNIFLNMQQYISKVE